LLKFLSGENSGLEVDLTGYAEQLAQAGFRNKIQLKQLAKKELVKLGIEKDHIKLLLREVKRLRAESKAAAAKAAVLSAENASPLDGLTDEASISAFGQVRQWLEALSVLTGESLAGYDAAFYDYGIDMMSSVPLIEQSDLRDIGMPRNHAEIFFAAAEEEKRRQSSEADHWDPTYSFQRALNKLNNRPQPVPGAHNEGLLLTGEKSATEKAVRDMHHASDPLLSTPAVRKLVVPKDPYARRRGLNPGDRTLPDLMQRHRKQGAGAVLGEVKRAVESGADVMAKDVDDVTPLARACEYGDLGVVIYLMTKGADIQAKDTYMMRPVHYAAAQGHVDILRVLAR
jgi:hypothetical protein